MGKTLSKIRSAGATVSKPIGKTLPKSQVSNATKVTRKTYNKEVTHQVDKIMSALEEANEIHAGKKKRQTFDDFLKEI